MTLDRPDSRAGSDAAPTDATLREIAALLATAYLRLRERQAAQREVREMEASEAGWRAEPGDQPLITSPTER